MECNRLKIKDITPKESFEPIEKKLLKLSSLKFKDLPDSIINLKEVSIEKVILLILKLNISFPTITVGTRRIQCGERKNRSQGDLFRIVRYYKDVSLEEFRKALFKLINNGEVIILYCPDVKKLVVKDANGGLTCTMLLSSPRMPASWIFDISKEQTRANYDPWYFQNTSAKSFKLKDELGLISQIYES